MDKSSTPLLQLAKMQRDSKVCAIEPNIRLNIFKVNTQEPLPILSLSYTLLM